MSTQVTENFENNVGVRFDPVGKRGREIVLVRRFEDAGGVREFTLYLGIAEAQAMADLLDQILFEIGK